LRDHDSSRGQESNINAIRVLPINIRGRISYLGDSFDELDILEQFTQIAFQLQSIIPNMQIQSSIFPYRYGEKDLWLGDMKCEKRLEN
jgi:hypothetical protein